MQSAIAIQFSCYLTTAQSRAMEGNRTKSSAVLEKTRDASCHW